MSNLFLSYYLSHTSLQTRLMENHQKILLGVSILLVLATPQVFAQTVNCPNGCSVVVNQNPTPPIITTGPNAGPVGPTINGVNIKDSTDWILQQIQKFLQNIIGTGIPNNPYVNTGSVQNATSSGFRVVNDLSNAGYDTSQFVTDLLNSFKPFHISFWIIFLISTVITIVIIVKAGEGIIKRLAYLAAIAGAILLIMLFLHIYMNI